MLVSFQYSCHAHRPPRYSQRLPRHSRGGGNPPRAMDPRLRGGDEKGPCDVKGPYDA